MIPAFEEAFYLATQLDRLSETTEIFTAPFPTLARLHDKATFTTLAQKLGLPLPETIVTRVARRADRGDRPLAALVRAGRLLARRRLAADQHRPAGRAHEGRGRRADPRAAVAGAAVHRRADALHLQHDPRRQGDHSPLLPGPAPVGALDRDRLRDDRPAPLARGRREDRRRGRLHGPDGARLRRHGRRGPLAGRVQPARDRRGAADQLRGGRCRPRPAGGAKCRPSRS